MVERRCRYCKQVFQPSKFQPGQSVCSGSDCQRRRRSENRHRKIAFDPEYRQVCQDSSRKWRARNPEYWRRRRESNPAIVERNRQQQRVRDQKRRLRDLANNNSAFDLTHSAAQVWLLGAGLEHLANNNSARAQVWVLEALPPRRGPQLESCQQQRSGLRLGFRRIKGSAPCSRPNRSTTCIGCTGPSAGRSVRSNAISAWAGIPSGNISMRRHKVRRHGRAPANSIPSRPPSPNGWKRTPPSQAAVMEQRLRPLGYTGGPTILRDYLQKARPQAKPSRAFHSHGAGAWRAFRSRLGSLRRAELLPETSASCTPLPWWKPIAACSIWSSLTARALKLSSAVTCMPSWLSAESREKSPTTIWPLPWPNTMAALVRFLPRFLAFAREYGFYPRACNPAAGWEKGKVERAIGYARQSFWPLREFTDLHDVNRQVRQWLSEVANQRQHRETRQRPLDRFQPAALKSLPVIPYDHRDHVEVLVHKDLRVQFDGNRYCVPHRYVGRRLIVKADSSSVTLYDRVNEIVSYPRSWRRGPDFRRGAFRSRSRRDASRGSEVPCAATPVRRFWRASVHRPCWKPICATSPTPTAPCRAS